MLRLAAAVGFVAACTFSLARADGPYPDLDDFQYANYAEPDSGSGYVVYDYVDYDSSGGGGSHYDNSDGSRYQMDEVQRDYDYNSRDY